MHCTTPFGDELPSQMHLMQPHSLANVTDALYGLSMLTVFITTVPMIRNDTYNSLMSHLRGAIHQCTRLCLACELLFHTL